MPTCDTPSVLTPWTVWLTVEAPTWFPKVGNCYRRMMDSSLWIRHEDRILVLICSAFWRDVNLELLAIWWRNHASWTFEHKKGVSRRSYKLWFVVIGRLIWPSTVCSHLHFPHVNKAALELCSDRVVYSLPDFKSTKMTWGISLWWLLLFSPLWDTNIF